MSPSRVMVMVMPLYWKPPPVPTSCKVEGAEVTATGTAMGSTAASAEVWKVCSTPPPGTPLPPCWRVRVILRGKLLPEAGLITPGRTSYRHPAC